MMNSEHTRSLWTRIRERFQYGLAFQEIIDVLHRRFKVMIYPYFIVAENCNTELIPNNYATENIETRYLNETDMSSIVKIRPWQHSEVKLKELLKNSKCLGVFADGKLAGCTWCRSDNIPIPNSKQLLVMLNDDEAYLFDAFVAREFRGFRLAPIVRYNLYIELNKIGKSQFYSITLAFNSSSRRFKAKLGAEEIELRLLIGVVGWRALDFRLKTYKHIKSTPKYQSLTLSLKA